MKRLLVLCAILFIGVWANSKADNLDSLNQFTGWDYSGDIRTQKLKTAGYTYTQLMQNGKELFTADKDGYIRIWNLETGKLRYSKKVVYTKIIANYQDSVVYYYTYATINKLNLNNGSLKSTIIKIGDTLRFSFHPSNAILISYYLIDDLGYKEYHKLTVGAFDCNSMQYTNHTDIMFARGREFQWTKNNKYFSYIFHDYERWGEYYTALTCVARDSTTLITFNGIDNYVSFSHNEDYFIVGKDSTLQFCNLNNANSTITKLKLLYPMNQFVIDYRNRLISTTKDGSNLIISNWLPNSAFIYLPLPDTMGIASLVLNSDSTVAIITGSYGKLMLVDLPVSSNFHLEANANRTEINVGEQVNFTNKSTGLINNFRWILGDGTESTAFDLKHIFKKAGDFDVQLIASDGLKTDTVVYKNLIHVAPMSKPRLAAYSEDRRFGYLPLTVKFQNTTNKPYTFLEWNFGDSTSNSNDENPTHTFYKLGKYDVTLTMVSQGDTLRMTKSFNVISQELQNNQEFIGQYGSYGSGQATDYTINKITFLGNNNYCYTLATVNRTSNSMGHWARYDYLTSIYNTWDKVIDFAHNDGCQRYLDNGVIFNTGPVYSNTGRFLFDAPKIPIGTIIKDRTRDSLILYNSTDLYYYNEYFELLWSSNFEKLTNDSCRLLCVSSQSNGNLSLFLFLKTSKVITRIDLNPDSGEFIKRKSMQDSSINAVNYLNDNTYYMIRGDELTTFTIDGVIQKSKKIASSLPIDKFTFYTRALDTNYFGIITKFNSFYRAFLFIFDKNLNQLYSYHDSNSKWNFELTKFEPLMLEDKSIVIVTDDWNSALSSKISRYFFPAIYDDSSSTSIPEPTPGERLVNAYPNPAHNEITISTKDEVDINNIEITDINGNMCNTAIKQRSDNSLVLDISKLASGTYYYRLISKDKQIKGKFVKQ